MRGKISKLKTSRNTKDEEIYTRAINERLQVKIGYDIEVRIKCLD